MKLSIIIPCYNERNTIEEIIKRVSGVNLGNTEKEIIVVDDGSNDGSFEILKRIEEKFKLKLLRHENNLGKGQAIITALPFVSGDYVIIQDADLECDPKDLKKILDKALKNNAQTVYGYRKVDRSKYRIPYIGYIGGAFLTFLANFLYGINISDVTVGYKIFKSELIKNLPLKCKGFDFCPEVTARIAKKRIKIFQVAVDYCPRTKREGKKLKIKDGIKIAWTLLKYRFID